MSRPSGRSDRPRSDRRNRPPRRDQGRPRPAPPEEANPAELPIQDLVTRELTVRGSYGFREEFEQAADALAAGTIDVRPLIERLAPLEEGSDLFRELGAGELDAVKVVLQPNG